MTFERYQELLEAAQTLSRGDLDAMRGFVPKARSIAVAVLMAFFR